MDNTKLKKGLFISLLLISVLSAITLCHIDHKLELQNPIEQEQLPNEDISYVKAKLIYVLYEGVNKALKPNLSR